MQHSVNNRQIQTVNVILSLLSAVRAYV